MKTYIALLKSNLRLTLRDRAMLFLNYAFPLIFFFAFASLFAEARGAGISSFVGTVLTIGILGNGLWGAGMRAVQDREAGILKRFKVTPISPMPILAASMVSGWLLYLPVVILLIALAHLVYGMPVPQHWASLLLMASLGVCAFRALGLILAAVTNTMQEATVLIQLFYIPMVLLSGATVPAAALPRWVQTVAGFLPASYLVTAFQGIFFNGDRMWDHRVSIAALLVTLAAGLFLARQLFRWDKEEKISRRNKAWVLAVLAPFLLIGGYKAFGNGRFAGIRSLSRPGAFLIRNVRVFVGDGRVIENGSVLVRDGKIAGVFETAPAPAGVEIVEGAGKTLLPGLIDAHVHLSAVPGASSDSRDFEPAQAMRRAASALLYSGVTAARSVGDPVREASKLREEVEDGGEAGARVFVWSPLFTAQPSLGTEFLDLTPAGIRGGIRAAAVMTPKTPEEARRQIKQAKSAGVNGVKVILEAAGGDGNRVDLLLAHSIAEEAKAQKLPVATHTGDSRDVFDAVEIGSASVEHGSWRDELPESLLARMAREGVFYDPTLSAAEACSQYSDGDATALSGSLAQQALPASIITSTRSLLNSGKARDSSRAERCRFSLEQAGANLVRAWKAGTPLVAGTDSGDPLIVHGAALHHELLLWVRMGIPPEVALQAATFNAARLLRASNRIGSIKPGLDADLVLVDGNPLVDIGATERISLVVVRGERLSRPNGQQR